MADCTLKTSLGYTDMSQKTKQKNQVWGLTPVTPELGRLSQEGCYELRDQAGVFRISIGPLKDEQGLEVQNVKSHKDKVEKRLLRSS